MKPNSEEIWRYTTVNGISCETVGTEVAASAITAAFCELPAKSVSHGLIQNTDDPHSYNLENFQEVLAKNLFFSEVPINTEQEWSSRDELIPLVSVMSAVSMLFLTDVCLIFVLKDFQ